MKKVLIFSLQYYPFVGGAEVAIKEITDRISPEEYEFHMVTSRFDSTLPKLEKVGNVTVHRVGFGKREANIGETFTFPFYLSKILFVPLATFTARKLHKEEHFDAAWAMMSYMLFPLVLLRILKTRIPYLLTLQEGDPFEHVFKRARIRFFAPLLRYGFKYAATVQAISTFLLTWARQAGFSGNGVVIPNGVDTARFARDFAPEEVLAMQQSLGKKKEDIFLVTTSRLVHKNAIDDVICALTHLPPNVYFLIYGIGPDEEKLRALAKSLGVEHRARFMGQIGHQEMPLMLSACDIFTRPSRSEGMGNSFIEAMAAGLPVIATQEGGISDFLFDKTRNPDKATTGWAVDANAPVQIAEAVTDITEHPEEVARVVQTAKGLALSGYDWDTISVSMQELFERMTG